MITLSKPNRRQKIFCEEQILPNVARQSIAHGLTFGKPQEPDLARHSGSLIEPGAAFVTLKLDGNLRGCVGSIEPRQPLVLDVAHNAQAAAFGDERFPPLNADEFDRLQVSISILSPLTLLPASNEKKLLEQLIPGQDGLVLTEGPQRALFLPQVWKMLPHPKNFIRQLKIKAGLQPGHWSDSITAQRFVVRSVGDSKV